jgi:hypothetical protein
MRLATTAGVFESHEDLTTLFSAGSICSTSQFDESLGGRALFISYDVFT